MSRYIPFNRPFIAGKELYYIAQTVTNGRTAANGPFTRKCEHLLEVLFSAKKVLLTHSCTAALEMSAILCDLGPGDEVILPSFTFVSTANAFALRGAKLVFVDVDPNTLNMNVHSAQRAISPRTKAIVPVHYAGVGCEMDGICALARDNAIAVIEDAAQGVNATYKGQYLGTIGDLGTYSFHETKNFISGEGGALVINNEKFIDRAEVVRERGTNRSSFFRGEVPEYTWVDIGSSYLMPDMLAAFLYAQFENMDHITERRNQIWDIYFKALVPLANEGLLRLPYIPPACSSNSHLFYIILKDEDTRNALMDTLKQSGIHAVFHYVPLHLSEIGRSMGYREGQLPETESLSGRLLRLPFYYELTREDQIRVVDQITSFFKH